MMLSLRGFVTLSILIHVAQAMRGRTKYGCEGSDLEITCNGETQINIIRANYGRFSNSICNNRKISDWSVNCMEPKTLRILNNRCKGRKTCIIPVNSNTFGDPCPGTEKYLEVNFNCVATKTGNNFHSKPIAPWMLDLSATPITISDSEPITTTTTQSSIIVEEIIVHDFEPILDNYIYEDEEDMSENQENEELTQDYIYEPTQFCRMIRERNLFWDATEKGRIAFQNCPLDSSGIVQWKCEENARWSVDFPNFSDCQSNWLREIDSSRYSAEELCSKLVEFTSTRVFYGGDIPILTRFMKIITEKLTQELILVDTQEKIEGLSYRVQRKFNQFVSSIIDEKHLLAWRDLNEDIRRKHISHLFRSLIEINMIMAEAFNSERIIQEETNNIFTDIRVVGNNYNGGGQTFHKEDAIIRIRQNTFAKSNIDDVLKIGFFSLENLEIILPGINSSFINSDVVGASIGYSDDVDISSPIVVELHHKLLETGGKPKCVAWNFDINNWSEKGCKLIKTSREQTTCHCSKFSQYTIIIDNLPDPEPQESLNDKLFESDIVLVSSCILITISIFVLFVFLFVLKKKKNNTTNLSNSDEYYPSLPTTNNTSTSTKATTLYSDYQSYIRNGQMNPDGPSIIYKNNYATNVIPYTNTNQNQLSNCHIYSEIDPKYSTISTLNYLQRQISPSFSDSSSATSSDELMNRASPSIYQANSNRPLLIQPNYYYRQTLNNPLQQPVAISHQNGEQFVRINLESPYPNPEFKKPFYVT